MDATHADEKQISCNDFDGTLVLNLLPWISLKALQTHDYAFF